MRWIALSLLTLLSAAPLRGGFIEPFGGEPVIGKVELDFGGIVFRPTQGPVVKVDFSNLYRVQFDNPGADEVVPGVVLLDGTRLPGPYSPLTEPTVRFPKRNLTVPSSEIAWIVYQRFPGNLTANVAAGQTGALLPGGDFFSGTVRGADADGVKVFNSIFGQRKLEARVGEVLAAVLKATRPVVAQYEVRTTDGALFAAETFAPDKSGLTLRNALFDGLRVASSEVVEIRAGANRCRSLASTPQLHAEPPAGMTMSPDGVMTADTKTLTTCPVPAGFTEFVTRVAPGEDVKPGQRIVFTVYANGAAIGRSGPLGAGDPPQAMRVALNGARGLILRVEIGAGPAGSVASGRWMQGFFLRR